MHAVVRSFVWTDLERRGVEADPEDAHENLEVTVGPFDGPGEELYQVQVCTPRGLRRYLETHPYLMGRHWLFVQRFDPDEITTWLRHRIESIHAESYAEVAERITRVGLWEFEDYRA